MDFVGLFSIYGRSQSTGSQHVYLKPFIKSFWGETETNTLRKVYLCFSVGGVA